MVKWILMSLIIFLSQTGFAKTHLDKTIEISAHRGSHIYKYSENTLAAFAEARSMGASSIEFDVIYTRDGELVLNHDFKVSPEDFNGLSEVKDLREMTVSEIQKLTHKKDGSKIPTLAEFFEVYTSSSKFEGMTLHLEVKNKSLDPTLKDNFVGRILDYISFYKLENQVIVRSFDWSIVERFKKLAPKVRRALLIGRWKNSSFWRYFLNDYKTIVERYQPALVAPEKSLVNEIMVEEWQSYGVAVNPYTVNNSAEAQALLRLGVDGLTTDKPLKMYQSFGATSLCGLFFDL